MEPSFGQLDSNRIEMILSIRFHYYKRLSPSDKQKFVERTKGFMNGKEFIPRNEVDIADSLDDIKVLISAAAIQVTFGLTEYELPHFTKVYIYPKEYYNKMTHHWHKGEANVMGILVFSWKALKEGYADDHEKMNLGLHEMAHALMLTIDINDGRDAFFAGYFDKWLAVSNAEFLKLEKHEASFFRDYGGTNHQEFFAVCIEYFFGAAEEFKAKHPEIYKQTCILLNQDPASDYSVITDARNRLLEDAPEAEPTNLIYRTKGRTGMSRVDGVFVMFICSILFMVVAATTDFSTSDAVLAVLFQLLLVAVVLRYLIHSQFYVFENAFAIGFEIMGLRLGRLKTFSATHCLSITFLPERNAENSSIKTSRIDAGRVILSEWECNHIKPEQLSELKEATREFCAKNHIGFRNYIANS